MKIQDVTIQNFRGISSKPLSVSLDPQLTVFIGSNGIGKSTILDAISMVLSRMISIISNKRQRYPFKETDFPSGRYEQTTISLDTNRGDSWDIVKAKSSNKTVMHFENNSYLNTLSNRIIESDYNCSIPVFIHYNTNRAVLDIPLKIRKKHTFSLLEAYDHALLSGVNFRHFFEWFRNREDLENELKKEHQDFSYHDKQLNAIRQAIESIMSNFSALSVRRNPLRMVVKKADKELRVDHLSDGEKCMLAMVGDLARRLAIANPTMEEPLTGKGIVLIDEIELHLHPAWQRMILGKLCEIFPNCQFIVSTHSPQTVGEVSHQHIRILEKNTEDQLIARTPDQALGLTSGEILEELMHTSKRDEDISKKLDAIYTLIDDEEFTSAKDQISALKIELNGSIPEIVRMEGLITMLECDE
jgi:predicted ATP-binding protein involved in virulence